MTNTLRAPTAVALLGLGLVAALAAPSRGSGPYSFPHRPHLSEAALAGGADKDCRVCHDYAKGTRESHLAGCDRCHVDGEHLEKKLTGASTRPEFAHREHLFTKDGAPRADVSCFTCHAMRVGGDWIEYSVPTGGLGPKSRDAKSVEKTCADCHAAHDATGAALPQYAKTGDGKACAVCHLKETSILPLRYRGDVRPSASKPFAHADHGGATGDCASCHGAVKTSKTIWDYDPVAGTTEKCATCHVGDAGKPLVVTAADTLVSKVDFSNFPHEKHLGEFSKMTCATCHYPETDEQGRKVFAKRTASAEPVGRAQLVRFAACDVCHGHDGWAPQKSSWHVEGHGVGAWACFKCHDGTPDAAGKLALATAVVGRATLGPSRIAWHLHPGVTARGEPLADPTQDVGGTTKACTDCHIGNIAELTSRLTGKVFAHEPHLPANPRTDDCVQCHTTSSTSRRSEDLDRFNAARQRATATTRAVEHEKRCIDCHISNMLPPELGDDEGPAPPDRKVPQFDHGGHVKAASLVEGVKGIACVECHTTGGKFGYETPPDVLDCTKCHSHDEKRRENYARTGPKTSQGDSSKCLHCHDAVRGDANGRVGSPPRETIERKHLALGPGTQFHDKTGDCAACHARDGAKEVAYPERIAKASVRLSIHEDPKFADRPFNDPKSDCTTCHRTPPRGYLRSLTNR